MYLNNNKYVRTHIPKINKSLHMCHLITNKTLYAFQYAQCTQLFSEKENLTVYSLNLRLVNQIHQLRTSDNRISIKLYSKKSIKIVTVLCVHLFKVSIEHLIYNKLYNKPILYFHKMKQFVTKQIFWKQPLDFPIFKQQWGYTGFVPFVPNLQFSVFHDTRDYLRNTSSCHG